MQKNDQAPDRRSKDRAFTALMERYADDVLRLCYCILRERAAAEDAMQETFLKAYRHMDGMRQPEYAKTWLMRIAINTCRDARSSAWTRHRADVSLEDLPPAPADFTETDDSVVREVMRLKPKEREVILLHYYEEMSAAECAQALGVTPSGFYRRLKRALGELKPRLERRGLE